MSAQGRRWLRQGWTPGALGVHTHTYIRVKRTHLHVGVSHSRKPACDKVHVPAQAMNSINLGVKRWKEPLLIAFIGQLPVVVPYYAIFVATTHTPAASGPLSPFTVARLVCQKHQDPDEQMMHMALAPPTAASLSAPSAPIQFSHRSR